MTKQVTTTFSVSVRSLWHVASMDLPTAPEGFSVAVLDEDGLVVGWFSDLANAQSCCTDHNRTTRQRAKQREHRKADAKSGHADHGEDTDEETEIHKNPALKRQLMDMLPKKGGKKAN